LAKTLCQQHHKAVGKEFLHFCFFFLSTFLWVLPTITTSQRQNLGMF
jgi:hypothetical protein